MIDIGKSDGLEIFGERDSEGEWLYILVNLSKTDCQEGNKCNSEDVGEDNGTHALGYER